MRSRKKTAAAIEMMEYLLENRNIIKMTTRMESLLADYQTAKKYDEPVLDAEARPVGPGRKKWVGKEFK